MSSIVTYNNAYGNQLLNKVVDSLLYNQFSSFYLKDHNRISITKEELKKSIWLCSILASSAIDEHKRKAQIFASLITLQYSNDLDLLRACYIIYSRIGNLTATKFLSQLFVENVDITNQQFKYNFGSILDFEVASARNNYTLNVGSESFLATNFQKKLWDDLRLDSNLSISAPTSSGKSFIIKKFIQKKFSEVEKYTVLYIVPSRALINQVSDELRTDCDLKNVVIYTAFLESDLENSIQVERQIYVLTPERCLRLLQSSWKEKFPIDFIFIDEIQNIEDEQGRGTLIEYVLKELSILYFSSKIIIAGPNITSADVLFDKIFALKNLPVETTLSPVFQVKLIIESTDENFINIRLKTYSNQDFSFIYNTDFSLKKSLNKSIGNGMANLINLFGRNGQNIIYAPKTDLVESWTLKFAESQEEFGDLDIQVRELIEFLQEEIHPKYFLIQCLQKKCAFHHSKLPDIVRKEIEDLFLSGKINNLFCTSTLLEGVNLPANNLFLIIPKKRTDPLSSFEFGNLIGRAGRIRDSLYGTIFCIVKDELDWTEDYFNKSYDKIVTPASEKSLLQSQTLLQNLTKPLSEISKTDINTIIFLRHKFLKNEEELISYLKAKNYYNESGNAIINNFKEYLGKISLKYDILRLNPVVDPIRQNDLFIDIQEKGVKNWVININSNFYKRIKRSDVPRYDSNSLSMFWQIDKILNQLDSIFKLRDEAYFKHNISLSISQMCAYGSQWLENLSYRELIEKDIAFNASHVNLEKRIDPNKIEDINKRINVIIKINSSIVTYVIVKYLKLLNDLLSDILTEEEKEEYKFSLALPTMLELGTTEGVVIQLISKGVSRSVALKIFNQFKKITNYKELDVFTWLKQNNTIGLKNIYERYLHKLKLLGSAPEDEKVLA